MQKIVKFVYLLSANKLAVKLGFIAEKIQILDSEPINYTFTVSRLR